MTNIKKALKIGCAIFAGTVIGLALSLVIAFLITRPTESQITPSTSNAEVNKTEISATDDTVINFLVPSCELSPIVEYFAEQEGVVHTSMSLYEFADFFDELKAAAPDSFSGIFFRELYGNLNLSTAPISLKTDIVTAERNSTSAKMNGDFDVSVDTDKLRAAIEEWTNTRKEIMAAVFEAGVKTGTTEREAVKLINDYICNRLSYDYQYLAQKPLKDVLKTNTCVCNGYARMFYEMVRACEIPVRCVYGTTQLENKDFHMWNSVFIDGEWHSIDVTSNDNAENPNSKTLGADFSNYFEYGSNPYDYCFVN